MLKIGEPAPDFSAIAYSPADDSIVKIELKDYRGKWVIMSFHPGDFTFTCATDLNEFQKLLPILKENNCEMLGVSMDSVYVHKMWVKESPRMKDVKFLIIDDSNQVMHRDYGALSESSIAESERITVIINPDGVVEYVEKTNPRMGKRPTHILYEFIGLKFLYSHQSSDNNSIVILPAEWKSAEQDVLTIKIPQDVGTI